MQQQNTELTSHACGVKTTEITEMCRKGALPVHTVYVGVCGKCSAIIRRVCRDKEKEPIQPAVF